MYFTVTGVIGSLFWELFLVNQRVEHIHLKLIQQIASHTFASMIETKLFDLIEIKETDDNVIKQSKSVDFFKYRF